MTNSYLEHPTEEALERFLLNRSEDSESEIVETHILACEACVTRLESLELHITDLKAALVQFEEARINKELTPARSSWKSWLTLPTLSWAGAACAAFLIGVTVMPHAMHRTQLASFSESGAAAGDLSACRGSDGTDATLATCRGAGTLSFPESRPLNLRVDTSDLPHGPVDIQLVNGEGTEVWQGQAAIKNDRAELKLPKISQSGAYFLRFYAPSAGAEHELLREFRFEVK